MTLSERKALLKKIIRVIRSSRTFLLSGHEKPDGDTVGSELAVAGLLRRLGKKVDVVNKYPVPDSLRFLPGAARVRASARVEGRYDVAMIFECSGADRMGNILDLDRQAGCVINIDHHRLHARFGDINWINPRASSNSEQLYYLFEAMGTLPTKEEATCLYAGLMTDTGRFRHSNTNPEALRIASKLVERGAPPHLVSEKIYETKPLSALRLLGFALSRFQLTDRGRIAAAGISQADFRRLGSSEEETEEIVNYPLQVPTVLISILARESEAPGRIKVSLRSRRGVDVCALAQGFGGGGHQYASGCKAAGTLPGVLKRLVAAARRAL